MGMGLFASLLSIVRGGLVGEEKNTDSSFLRYEYAKVIVVVQRGSCKLGSGETQRDISKGFAFL